MTFKGFPKLQVERECSHLKESIQALENENLAMKEENVKLRDEIEDLSEVKKVDALFSMIRYGVASYYIVCQIIC